MGITLNRSCGGCTACCKTHAVFEIKKPTGKWCPHCDTSRGCSIYPNHPRACKDFKCAWLRGFGEDGNRPDCTKIILDFHVTDALIKILQIWEVNGGTLRGSFAKESAQLALENGIAVILIGISGKIEMATGNIRLPKEALNQIGAEGIRIIQKYE